MKKLIYCVFFFIPGLCLAQTETTTTQQTTTTVPGATITMSVGGNGTTTQQTTITTITTTTNSGTTTQQPPPQTQSAPSPASSGCESPMMQGDYESAKSSIQQKDFEDTKLSLAKEITGSNCLYAEQVRGIMKLFTFEDSKLDFAKFAYDHCYDKSNYFKVNDAFEFDNSSQELNSYINSH